MRGSSLRCQSHPRSTPVVIDICLKFALFTTTTRLNVEKTFRCCSLSAHVAVVGVGYAAVRLFANDRDASAFFVDPVDGGGEVAFPASAHISPLSIRFCG